MPSRALASAGKARLRQRDVMGTLERVPMPSRALASAGKARLRQRDVMGTLRGPHALPRSGFGGQSPPTPTRMRSLRLQE